MLPKINGFKILEKIREEKIDSKVIILTAKSMIEDKLTGFNNGANDYLTKPFHIEELVARVNTQLRINNNQIIKDYIEVGDLRLNIKTTNLTCITTNESIGLAIAKNIVINHNGKINVQSENGYTTFIVKLNKASK